MLGLVNPLRLYDEYDILLRLLPGTTLRVIHQVAITSATYTYVHVFNPLLHRLFVDHDSIFYF